MIWLQKRLIYRIEANNVRQCTSFAEYESWKAGSRADQIHDLQMRRVFARKVKDVAYARNWKT